MQRSPLHFATVSQYNGGMFDIGFSEIVVIGLALLIFIRPEELPAIVRTVARIYAQISYAIQDFVEDLKQIK